MPNLINLPIIYIMLSLGGQMIGWRDKRRLDNLLAMHNFISGHENDLTIPNNINSGQAPDNPL